MVPIPKRPSRTGLWVLLALGLAAVVAVAAYYPRMPSGVVVKGRIEPAELRKIYGAISREQADRRREFSKHVGFDVVLIVYFRDVRSKVLSVDSQSTNEVFVNLQVPGFARPFQYEVSKIDDEWRAKLLKRKL